MNTQTDFTNMTEKAEEARMQEHASLNVEDTSLPMEQVLMEQNTQEGRAPLFVP
jgi:hypothetical protein